MDLRSLARQHAQRAGVNPDLFERVINQESGWNPRARSDAGAYGLTQAMPDSWKSPGFGVTPGGDMEDPNEQLRFGADYLAAMLQRYGGDEARALAAYNWGPGNADNWSGNPSALPNETNNYIDSITGGGGTGVLSGGAGDDMLGSSPRMNIIPPTIGEQLQSGALTKAETLQDKLFPNESEGQIGWFKSLFPNLTSQGVDDRLLAIGAGLLSGDDWASGMAAAAENLQGVVGREQGILNEQNATNAEWDWQADQSQRDRDWRSREASLDRSSRERMEASRAASSSEKYIGNVLLDDGTTRMATFRGGKFFDQNGEDISSMVTQEINNSDAYGSKFAPTLDAANKLRGTIMNSGASLEAIDRTYSALNDVNFGAAGVRDELSTAIKTLAGRNDLSEAEFMRKMAQGELQGMIGATREKVVGGGVMTEQDALRVIRFLGGDLTSALNNPSIIQERLATVREPILREYNTNVQQYGMLGDKYSNMPIVPLGETYVTPDGLYSSPRSSREPGALDQSNGAPSNIPEGWGEEWNFLTDEEKEQILNGRK